MMSSPSIAFFTAATNGQTKPERQAKAAEFATEVVKAGVAASFLELKLNDLLLEQFVKGGKSGALNREGALFCVSELIKQDATSATFLTPVMSAVIELQGDKVKPVATASKDASDAMMNGLSAQLAAIVMPQLLTKVHSKQGNIDRFEKIGAFCKIAGDAVATLLAEAIVAVVPFLHDIDAKVAGSAKDCLKALCDTCNNPDMEPFLPALETCMQDEKQIPETVFKIASSTFVAEVEASTLAIMAPVLIKGLLSTSASSVKRQAARIVENLCKLVTEPRFLSGFTVKILPLLEAARTAEKDPECREVIGKAADALSAKVALAVPLRFNIVAATNLVYSLAGTVKPEFNKVFDSIAEMAAMLNATEDYKIASWESIAQLAVATNAMSAEAAAKLSSDLLVVACKSRDEVEEEDLDESAEVLCDLNFGLAYGAKVLLRKTKLKLLRGHRYGLLGQNDSGKTSLLQALADYKIDGFPTAEQCRTVFVATDIKTDLADLTVLDYMFNDPLLRDCGVSREDMEKRLIEVGFKEGAAANTTQKVGTLSGGWRMKLALSRAMLLKADILLLDEPTNHLDTYNVKWVEQYLIGQINVTSIMVSHDAGLLTRVCTDMIEIDELKLRYTKGNLEHLVRVRPEAKVYCELAAEGKFDFNFPAPGPLPGVKSKGKAILRMDHISFTYPGVKKPQLTNVSVQVSLNSRVACVGENGAGKSTMIKLLTGELEPDAGSGEVVKHPNCRVGYIAQHAFHHIEHHLDVSANEYIRNRFANGGDNEELIKVTSIPTEEEVKLMTTPYEFSWPQEDGKVLKTKEVVERFTERRREIKAPKGVEYEVVFKGKAGSQFVNRKILEKMGWEKPLKALDERIALRATQFARPLTKENVEKHLADVGLAAEFGTHMRIGALSGGQKVKVVLAAALWSQPHILILDEPTNYLDRESLGALARAIRAFEGGVVMITHNSQFCDNLCPVVWHLQNNTLDVKGDAEWMAEAAKELIVVKAMDQTEMVDKFGNTIELKEKKPKLTAKQKKDKAQRRLKRFKETGEDYDSAEDELDE